MNQHPSDPILYLNIKEEAKQRFRSWPSAYASGWLIKTYKDRFRETYGSQKKPFLSKKSFQGRLTRWYREIWINVCELPKIVPCGRHPNESKKYWKDFPYCRPLYRITNKTPKTAMELSSKEIRERCKLKKKKPQKRLLRKSSSGRTKVK